MEEISEIYMLNVSDFRQNFEFALMGLLLNNLTKIQKNKKSMRNNQRVKFKGRSVKFDLAFFCSSHIVSINAVSRP